mgnify:CR=1 FL=1|tara:strand:+ start:2228 stop:2587 length:360 start_codon:yes stop_codon:yes gene_type:complete
MNYKKKIFNYIPEIRYEFLFILVLLNILKIIYVYSTKFKKIIIVDKKHTYASKAKGSKSISDSNNNIYTLKNSLYIYHWKSMELFNKLDSGNKYEIEGHGIRVPILGLFPNITKVKLIN